MATGSIDEEAKARRGLTERCIGIVSPTRLLNGPGFLLMQIQDEPCGLDFDRVSCAGGFLWDGKADAM